MPRPSHFPHSYNVVQETMANTKTSASFNLFNNYTGNIKGKASHIHSIRLWAWIAGQTDQMVDELFLSAKMYDYFDQKYNGIPYNERIPPVISNHAVSHLDMITFCHEIGVHPAHIDYGDNTDVPFIKWEPMSTAALEACHFILRDDAYGSFDKNLAFKALQTELSIFDRFVYDNQDIPRIVDLLLERRDDHVADFESENAKPETPVTVVDFDRVRGKFTLSAAPKLPVKEEYFFPISLDEVYALMVDNHQQTARSLNDELRDLKAKAPLIARRLTNFSLMLLESRQSQSTLQHLENILLGRFGAGDLNETLAKKLLRDYLDRANNSRSPNNKILKKTVTGSLTYNGCFYAGKNLINGLLDCVIDDYKNKKSMERTQSKLLDLAGNSKTGFDHDALQGVFRDKACKRDGSLFSPPPALWRSIQNMVFLQDEYGFKFLETREMPRHSSPSTEDREPD